MTVLDANILLFAFNADAPQRPGAARWLRALFENGETVAVPWLTLWAIVRICTNSRIWTNPRPAKEAFELVREWLELPGVVVLQPDPRHAEILERLAIRYGASGPLLTDAVLAALAIENGARLASTDPGFRRFPERRWIDPLAQGS